VRALVQRVSHASVTINREVCGQIETGLLVFLGIEESDDPTDLEWLCAKIPRLRIFPDAEALMNRSVLDTG